MNGGKANECCAGVDGRIRQAAAVDACGVDRGAADAVLLCVVLYVFVCICQFWFGHHVNGMQKRRKAQGKKNFALKIAFRCVRFWRHTDNHTHK